MAFDPAALRHIIEAGDQSFKENSVSFIFDCPLCGSEKLYFRKSDGQFRCWKCAESVRFKGRAQWGLAALYGGRADDWQRLLEGEQGLRGRLDIVLEDPWGDDEEVLDIREPLVNWEWPLLSVGADQLEFEPGRQYLRSRGIGEAMIQKYSIRYSPAENRVQFPFVVDGQLVGWQGRLCGPAEILDTLTGQYRKLNKVLTTIQDGVQGRHFMFGDSLKHAKHAVLCEGPVDALKAELCGGNVASLGKAVTQYQLDYLGYCVDSLYIGLDPDAVEDISRLVRDKRMGLKTYILPPPKGCKDLGEAEPEAVYEGFRTARQFYGGQIIVQVGSQLCY